MKLYAPSYYKSFKCIADKCRHSCCIGWEIGIDEQTLSRYAREASHISELSRTVDFTATPATFIMKEDGRCPHLDSRGLCKIISRFGEEWIPHICREHPRFYNLTSHGAEVGIGMACEEAARIILSSDSYELTEIGEIEDLADLPEFDTVSLRERIFSVLCDRALSYRERLTQLYAISGVDPSEIFDSHWQDTVSALEYLEEDSRALFLCYSSALGEECEEYSEILERALRYFIYRHLSSSDSETDARLDLGFAFFAERLLASLIKSRKCDTGEVYEYGRRISEELEYSEENRDLLRFEFI